MHRSDTSPLPHALSEGLGRLHERIDLPGRGRVDLDSWRRARGLSGAEPTLRP